MYPLYFIAKNNLKKKKSDAIVLTGLIMLAVMMMYISVTVLFNGRSVLNKIHEKTNGMHWHMFVQKDLNEINKELPQITKGQNWSFDWDIARMGNLMMANISMGILLVFAVILLGITLIVIRFSINNFCELNMKNIGVLRASGYTAKQLIGSFIMEMFLLTLLGGMLGVAIGTILGDVVGDIVSSLVGVSYSVGFDIQSAAIVLIACIAIVLFITWRCSRKYGKITVLDALRDGIVAHNFCKNHIPLEQTRQPLALALGMKSILHTKAKNLGILFIVAMLSFCSCIGFGMYQNFAADTTYMMKLVGQEIGDAAYIGDDLDSLGSEIEKLPEVEKVAYMNSQETTISSGDKELNVVCVMWKEPDKLENNFMLEGRYPEYENEIILTNVVCDKLGVALGDTVNVEGTDGSKDYVIVGVDQEINGMGIKAIMNFEGGTRLNGECVTKQIFIYGTGELTIQELLDYLNETFPKWEAFDIQQASAVITDIVGLAMEMLCIIFVTVTVVVVVLVVYLLIKAKVIRERKNYGVYKAIGFTTGQLCVQTVLSNLPIMIAGALLGVLASIRGAEKVALLGLSTCGIEKCELNVAPIYLVITVAIVVGVAFVVALLTSYRIRKIEPVKMLTEE